MSLDYNILWVEDIDTTFGTYSRRTERHVESRNLRCHFTHIKSTSEFDIDAIDLGKYDLIIVDYHLGDSGSGLDIIRAVRQGDKHLHDVLFYSAAHEDELLELLTRDRFEGVYVASKDHEILLDKIKRLVDKSIKRTINPINIRGLVMDTTSEFDNIIRDTLRMSWGLLDDDEKFAIKEYICRLFKDKKKSADKHTCSYNAQADYSVSDLIEKPYFSSDMLVRLLDKVMNTNNANLATAKVVFFEFLKDTNFRESYKKDITDFRNKLAHVKFVPPSNSEPIYIGNINGTEYYCDEGFCDMMREKLLAYERFLKYLYGKIEEA